MPNTAMWDFMEAYQQGHRAGFVKVKCRGVDSYLWYDGPVGEWNQEAIMYMKVYLSLWVDKCEAKPRTPYRHSPKAQKGRQ